MVGRIQCKAHHQQRRQTCTYQMQYLSLRLRCILSLSRNWCFDVIAWLQARNLEITVIAVEVFNLVLQEWMNEWIISKAAINGIDEDTLWKWCHLAHSWRKVLCIYFGLTHIILGKCLDTAFLAACTPLQLLAESWHAFNWQSTLYLLLFTTVSSIAYFRWNLTFGLFTRTFHFSSSGTRSIAALPSVLIMRQPLQQHA